ncbi:MAG: hypothetical protein OJF47_002076 [Nitrospira sp.]|nr:MAG: hypothetical protein OJF47_002076 [Nitrospira sp.]
MKAGDTIRHLTHCFFNKNVSTCATHAVQGEGLFSIEA